MASSLGRLAANLSEDDFKYTSQVFQDENMDSFITFDDQQLPPKDQFYSILTDEGISDVQCQHVQKVWNTFGMKTMGEYHDLNLQSCWLRFLRTSERHACSTIN